MMQQEQEQDDEEQRCVCRPLLAAVLQSEVVPQVRAWVRGGQLPPFVVVTAERDGLVLALRWQEEGVRLTFAHEAAERRCPLSARWHHPAAAAAAETTTTTKTIRFNVSRFDIAAGVRAPLALSFGLRARYPFLLQRLRRALAPQGSRKKKRKARDNDDEALFFSRAAPPRCEGRFLQREEAQANMPPPSAAAAPAAGDATHNDEGQQEEEEYACAFYDTTPTPRMPPPTTSMGGGSSTPS